MNYTKEEKIQLLLQFGWKNPISSEDVWIREEDYSDENNYIGLPLEQAFKKSFGEEVDPLDEVYDNFQYSENDIQNSFKEYLDAVASQKDISYLRIKIYCLVSTLWKHWDDPDGEDIKQLFFSGYFDKLKEENSQERKIVGEVIKKQEKYEDSIINNCPF